jgi:FAD/FMN-containing dehydrogenase
MPWVLFYNVAGYHYYPQERVSSQMKGISDIARQVGVAPVKAVGKVMAPELMKVLQRPSSGPYWKLRRQGACQDIIFITIYEKLEDQIKTMYDLAYRYGYPASDLGVYLQPIVQGLNCHCEFNLFYDPENAAEVARVREFSAGAIDSLMAAGAHFSRPYGTGAGMIMNKDAANVAALTRVKQVLDPHYVMNPGKLCF